MDHKLADIAKSNGVVVMEGTAVMELAFHDALELHEISTSDNTYTARIAIGAFGKRSAIDKQMNRPFIRKPLPPGRNFTAVKYHVKANLPDDAIELHIFKDGYCGISKVEGEGRYCMCYLTTAASLQQFGGDIKAMEEGVLFKNPILKEYLTHFPSLYADPLVISQVNFSRKLPVEDHVLMTGDAAGLITPLCGNGMSMALHAAALAIPMVEKFLEEVVPDHLLAGFWVGAGQEVANGAEEVCLDFVVVQEEALLQQRNEAVVKAGVLHSNVA